MNDTERKFYWFGFDVGKTAGRTEERKAIVEKIEGIKWTKDEAGRHEGLIRQNEILDVVLRWLRSGEEKDSVECDACWLKGTTGENWEHPAFHTCEERPESPKETDVIYPSLRAKNKAKETEYCAGCDYELSTAIKAPNHTCHEEKGCACRGAFEDTDHHSRYSCREIQT